MAHSPVRTQRNHWSRLQLPLPCLLPGLLDPVAVDSDDSEMALYEDDSPCAPKKPRKGCRPNHYRVYSRPRDIPKLDYGLPGDFGKRARSLVILSVADFDLRSPYLWARCS